MEKTYQQLAATATQILRQSNKNRIIIAIVGVPGSGKTLTAEHVSELINKSDGKLGDGVTPIKAKAVGMDGFHLSREQLRQLSDPENAFKRRGAPFTFDSSAVVNFTKALNESCHVTSEERKVITGPSFDHKLKDPVEGGLVIEPDVNIILLEGLYLLLDIDPWFEISKLVDARWLIHVEAEETRNRVALRHVKAGIEANLDDAFLRVDSNDTLNGEFVMQHLLPVDLTIESIHEN